jgi:hypothetical protein
MKATNLLGLALAERIRQYRGSGDAVLDRFARLQEQTLHVVRLAVSTGSRSTELLTLGDVHSASAQERCLSRALSVPRWGR